MTTSTPKFRQLPGIFAFLVLAFLIGGCLSRPSVNTKTYAFSAPMATATNSAPGGRVLSIRTFQIAPPFDGRSLVYRTGDFSYERDPYAQFLSSPAQELAAAISGILSADGCFGAVVGMGSAATPDVLVEIDISQLYGDIRKPGSPCAVLAMHVIFVKARNGLPGKVILQRSYSRRIPVKSAAADAFMAGWNTALSEIFAEVASDFRNQENMRRDSPT
ncbi:MAG TPA: ABC-type transport auxiliary lipoprotein family protein [Candidatus Acidoferrales bacterium]|jgi:cholesterol transport system auxiliary component|nr:ABC-type transport auxiliary lipoprotein family protein [Candidatus Acidoferrales bacterium]